MRFSTESSAIRRRVSTGKVTEGPAHFASSGLGSVG